MSQSQQKKYRSLLNHTQTKCLPHRNLYRQVRPAPHCLDWAQPQGYQTHKHYRMAKQHLIKEYLDYLFYQTKCPTSTLIYFWLGPDLTYLAINAGSIWPLTCSMYCRYISRQVMVQSRWWNFLDKNSKSLNFSDNHGQKYWDKTDRKPTPPLVQCWFQYIFRGVHRVK